MAQQDYAHIHIESSLPKPWEEEQTFNDVLYDWMSRAPWLMISAAAHLLIFFILMAIPWEYLQREKPPVIQAQMEAPPEEPFEEPEEEIEEEIEEEEPIEEPVLKDAEISDHNETEDMEDFAESEGDPDFLNDSPFDSDAFNDVIGIGGGAGGKFGGRFGGRRNLRAAGGAGVQQALKDGLEWLKNHQSDDGSWDCDGFSMNCGKIGNTVCDGGGYSTHDVGVTGIALLAFLGDGNTTNEGPYRDVVSNGITWLKNQQDPDIGLIGDSASHDFIYNHAIATLAICEAYYFSKSPLLKRTAQDAINYILKARNPYSAWRYEVPPTGGNDTSVTGWMLFALASARDAGLKVDEAAFEGGLSWIDEVSDPATGRIGYDAWGSLSSRTPANEHFPREKGEAMTAVGLLCRIFLGQDPKDYPIMEKHGDLLLRTLPVWDPEGFGCDMYYWYYGTYAMFQMGGKYWKSWEDAMKKAVLESQRKDGDEKGSWDPVGPWGYTGGRVYATASMTLCLEVYFRYAQVLGAR
jgi:hypothetical protein